MQGSREAREHIRNLTYGRHRVEKKRRLRRILSTVAVRPSWSSRRRLRAGWRGRNRTDREIRFRVELGEGEGRYSQGQGQSSGRSSDRSSALPVASVPAGDPCSATHARRPLPWTRNHEAGLVRASELQPCHRVARASSHRYGTADPHTRLQTDPRPL